MRAVQQLRVRFHIFGNARIDNVGKSQTCMVSKLRIIWKQTVEPAALNAVPGAARALPRAAAAAQAAQQELR